jgi:hypothetical protein
MDVCIVCVYSVSMLLWMQLEVLRRADPSSKVSYGLWIGSRNWKSGQGQTKGCRAIKVIWKKKQSTTDVSPVIISVNMSSKTDMKGRGWICFHKYKTL